MRVRQENIGQTCPECGNPLAHGSQTCDVCGYPIADGSALPADERGAALEPVVESDALATMTADGFASASERGEAHIISPRRRAGAGLLAALALIFVALTALNVADPPKRATQPIIPASPSIRGTDQGTLTIQTPPEVTVVVPSATPTKAGRGGGGGPAPTATPTTGLAATTTPDATATPLPTATPTPTATSTTPIATPTPTPGGTGG